MLEDAKTTNKRTDPRVVNVAASSLMVGLLQGQVIYLRDRGFDVTVISPAGKQLDKVAGIEGVRAIELPIARNISPVRDLVSLWHLWRLMRSLRPNVTNVGTPKAGLLGGLAAWLNRVPCRFYTLRGLRFETTHGLKRQILVYFERLACSFAHRVICVSPSLREKAVAAGLTSVEKTVVFGAGSSNGVDAARFAPTPETLARSADLRCELGIPLQAPIIGFVGRMVPDKGIPELAEAFVQLTDHFPDLRLLLVGRVEEGDPLPVETLRCLESHPHVAWVGRPRTRSNHPARDSQREERTVEETAPYYAMMDVCVLPSHREGLPNVVLEAQAAGKPVVAARATGAVDAVLDGETGLLFPVGDAAALVHSVAWLLTDKSLAGKLARAGQERVRREFRQEQIWEALYQEYLGLLQTKSSGPSEPPRVGKGRGSAWANLLQNSSEGETNASRRRDAEASVFGPATIFALLPGPPPAAFGPFEILARRD